MDSCRRGSSGHSRRRVAAICSGLHRTSRRCWTNSRSTPSQASRRSRCRRRLSRASRRARAVRYTPAGSVLRRSSRLTVDGLRPSSIAVARTVVPRSCSWAMTARSFSDRNRGDSTTTGLVITGGYSRTLPLGLGTLRPNRHRVPVRRLTPTVRHASVLLTPCAISRTNSARCCDSGSTPGQPEPATTTSRRDACCDVDWNPPRHGQPAPAPVDPLPKQPCESQR